jgi:plasmid replication initiation protein
MENLNDDLLVVKSNKLIEAHYKLPILEQKLILLITSLINKNDEDFKPYKIKICELNMLLGINDKNSYRKVAEITKEFMKKVLEIKEPNRMIQLHWISTAKYYFNEGYVELEFHPELKPYLIKLQEFFTIYNLKNTIQLKSAYSIRIYELLKQYENLAKRIISVENLRIILQIDPDEYKNYADFKKKVLLVAMEELKEKTDLYFDIEEIKKSKKVISIKFNIYSKFNEMKTVSNAKLYTKLQQEFNLTNEQLNDIIKKYDEDYILNKLFFLLEHGKSENIKDKTVYFLTALKDNYEFENEKSVDVKITSEDHLKDFQNSKEFQEIIYLLPKDYKNKKIILNKLSKYFISNGVEYLKDNIIYANNNVKDIEKYSAYLDKTLKENWGNGSYFDYKNMQNLQDKEYNEIYDNILKNVDKVDYFGLEVSKYIIKMTIEDKKKLMSYAIDTLDETGKNNMYIIMAQMRSIIFDKINNTNKFKNCPV